MHATRWPEEQQEVQLLLEEQEQQVLQVLQEQQELQEQELLVQEQLGLQEQQVTLGNIFWLPNLKNWKLQREKSIIIKYINI